MGSFKLAYKVLKKEYRDSILYAFTLVLSVAIIFVFFNYAQNDALGNDLVAGIQGLNFSRILSMIMIVIALVAACFGNNIYLNKKIDNVAIIAISGAGVSGVTKYLIAQNLLISVIAIPLGMVLGFLLNPLMNIYLYSSLGVEGSIWAVGDETVVLTIVYILFELAAATFIDAGFAYRNDILDLLNADKSSGPIKSDKLTGLEMSVIIYWILVILPFVIFAQGDLGDAISYMIYSIIGAIGVYGLYSKGLPKIIRKLQKKFNITKSIALVAFGNLRYSIAKTKSLVIMIIMAILCLICYCIQYVDVPENLGIIFVSYVTVTVLMVIIILYRWLLEAPTMIGTYKSLYKLGYTKKKINSIILRQTAWYYGLLLFFISIYTIPILGHFILTDTISLGYAAMLIAIYFIPIALSGIIAYNSYSKQILKGVQ